MTPGSDTTAVSRCVRVLEVVIDRRGLEAEADREVVTRALRPVLSAMEPAACVPIKQCARGQEAVVESRPAAGLVLA